MADAEVGEGHPAVAVEEAVRWTDVPVDDLRGVHLSQGVEELGPPADDLLLGHAIFDDAPVDDSSGQGASLHQLHDDEGLPDRAAGDVVAAADQGHDVRVGERVEGLHLALEPVVVVDAVEELVRDRAPAARHRRAMNGRDGPPADLCFLPESVRVQGSDAACEAQPDVGPGREDGSVGSGPSVLQPVGEEHGLGLPDGESQHGDGARSVVGQDEAPGVQPAAPRGVRSSHVVLDRLEKMAAPRGREPRGRLDPAPGGAAARRRILVRPAGDHHREGHHGEQCVAVGIGQEQPAPRLRRQPRAEDDLRCLRAVIRSGEGVHARQVTAVGHPRGVAHGHHAIARQHLERPEHLGHAALQI